MTNPLVHAGRTQGNASFEATHLELAELVMAAVAQLRRKAAALSVWETVCEETPSQVTELH